ncbi:hypothetical protein BCR44DRAFT_1206799 [Catenaria anguillulae PL171]|uniref:Uncharacterized protein n=1 Tax=Catenaria anguillulae PL171 TaxID=765915 RepID=A0A1Y2H1G1_9FUNG|nr:hypothetical protein BCR44DRAFT_1206799 [Catenaria anguillulae PL171]
MEAFYIQSGEDSCREGVGNAWGAEKESRVIMSVLEAFVPHSTKFLGLRSAFNRIILCLSPSSSVPQQPSALQHHHQLPRPVTVSFSNLPSLYESPIVEDYRPLLSSWNNHSSSHSFARGPSCQAPLLPKSHRAKIALTTFSDNPLSHTRFIQSFPKC